MAKINSFRDLLVWQKAMDLAVKCYGVSKRLPKDEQPVLGYQIRKCALSMPSNIAEGKARQQRRSIQATCGLRTDRALNLRVTWSWVRASNSLTNERRKF